MIKFYIAAVFIEEINKPDIYYSSLEYPQTFTHVTL